MQQSLRTILLLTILSTLLFSCNFLDSFKTDEMPPTVLISSHVDGDNVSGVIHIEAEASDNTEVFKVEFFIGSNKIGEDLNTPYSVEWDTTAYSNNTYYLKAKATDSEGNSAESDTIEVHCNNTTVSFFTDFSEYNQGNVSLESGDIRLNYPPFLESALGNSTLSITPDPGNSGNGNCLYFNDTAGSDDMAFCMGTFSSLSSGYFEFDMYITEQSLFFINCINYDGSASTSGILIAASPSTSTTDTIFVYVDGQQQQNNHIIEYNTWHTVGIAFNCSEQSYSLTVNGTTIGTSSIGFLNNISSINGFNFASSDSSGDTAKMYIDNITFRSE